MANGKAVLHQNGAIAEIVFSNPDQGFMDGPMEADLLTAIEKITADDTTRVCVLSGAEAGVFIRHYDLKVLAPQAEKMAARELVFTTDRPVPEAPIHVAMRLMESSETIFIAALTGTAMGGGLNWRWPVICAWYRRGRMNSDCRRLTWVFCQARVGRSDCRRLSGSHAPCI